MFSSNNTQNSYSKFEDDLILKQASLILRKRLQKDKTFVKNQEAVHELLRINYGSLEVEQFGCMFLNANYQLINDTVLFRGTVRSCATYPREIVREALLQNAVFVVLVHNHPSGSQIPSDDDIAMTHHLKDLLGGLDIVLFDHIIVAGLDVFSMRTAGYLG